ncbi:MAG: C25 family cysteine peptidase [Kouleothrix sp.]
MTTMKYISRMFLIGVCLAGVALVQLPAARAGAPEPPQITPLAGGVRVVWAGAAGALRDLSRHPDSPALATIGGVRLPAQLVALQIAGTGAVAPRIEQLASEPWSGSVPAAEIAIPQLAGGDARPGLAQHLPATLPQSPVLLLREAWLRGTRIAVLALSPVFSQAGAARAVTALTFSVPGASELPADITSLLDAPGPFLPSAPPANPAAGIGWKIHVTQPGIQRLSAAGLTAAGVPLGNPALLHLYHNGAELAIQQLGAGASLELRFYAGPPGDRWNSADTYWLTLESLPGQRMAPRSVAPAGATLSPFAFERGVWRNNTLYDSLLAGADGDHWFAVDMRIAPAPPGQPPTPPVITTATITPTLTMMAGPTSITVAGSSYLDADHTLQVTVAGSTGTATWSGVGDWAQTLTFAQPASTIVLTLPPASSPDGYEIDNVAWELPVVLDLKGRGAAFVGRAGSWRYQLAHAPAGATLYDVTNPGAPQLLDGLLPIDATNSQFEDGADGADARRYVLAGTGTLFAPTISRSQPFDFATPARVLYIVPAELRAALGPLLARRQAQGYAVRAIDAQAIYDTWSYGQVSPLAIRDFLRYAAATWATQPAGVTLVGDGTSDPLNYTKRNNTNYIPPFLANADPWIGETACESCFARLQGASPQLDALPDLAVARLPARNPAELSALVSKIITYETSPLDLSWRSRAVFVADNYRDEQNKADGAGDFAAFADASAGLQPQNMQILRLYYDPSPSMPPQPWRERNAVTAYKRTLALLSAGAGLVNYVGHASQYQWVITDYNKTPPYLLGQYDPDDLTNGARQPIVLEMTCLTGAFQTPSYGGTIDERLLLNPSGGAIGVWAPTGQGVAHGHDALQRGFYTKLWDAPPLSARLGELAVAGYAELYNKGLCCQDAISTYALLGDAMMPARVIPAHRLYLPATRR